MEWVRTPYHFDVLTGLSDGIAFCLRFRLTPDDSEGGCNNTAVTYEGGTASPNGLAYLGEVEDYSVELSPTAITFGEVTIGSNGTAQIMMSLAGIALLAGATLLVIKRRRKETV